MGSGVWGMGYGVWGLGYGVWVQGIGTWLRGVLRKECYSFKRGLTMRIERQRGFLPIAMVAIGIALVLLLALHGQPGGPDFAAILPLLFVGVISPLCLFAPLAHLYAGRVPQAPVLAQAYQRPPPSRRG